MEFLRKPISEGTLPAPPAGRAHGQPGQGQLQSGYERFTGYSQSINKPEEIDSLRVTPRGAGSTAAKLFTALLLSVTCANLWAGPRAERVVVVVWDGMRPDFVSASNTPTLMTLIRDGVLFEKHHPAYISTTEVNGTTLATGAYPSLSTIIGNKEYRPGIDASKIVQTEALSTVRTGDEQDHGSYLGVPTVAETLRHAGLSTAIAGAKGVTLLHDRAARDSEAEGVNVFAGDALPKRYAAKLRAELGPFPDEEHSLARDEWTTRALTGVLWEKAVPTFSLLWLCEPDYSQHVTGPGSPESLAAIRHSDEQLALVLAALEKKGLRQTTDVLVVSDHGFSTIDQNADVAAALRAEGIDATRAPGGRTPREGEVVVVGNGGSVFLYVAGHDRAVIERAVRSLQSQPYCGVVFTAQGLPGTFRLQEVRIDSPYAPDVVMATRWRDEASERGAPGLLFSDYGAYGHGAGMHGSLSRYDMHNLCVASGPHFQRGIKSEIPSGNIDIAPTIFSLLGARPLRTPSGRVLTEAFASPGVPAPPVHTHTLETSFETEDFTWRQYLKYTEVNGVLYFDEGNGQQVPRARVGGS
jgi:predicted AlkP superfamily pyrophosphatase or phosphodiesterase